MDGANDSDSDEEDDDEDDDDDDETRKDKSKEDGLEEESCLEVSTVTEIFGSYSLYAINPFNPLRVFNVKILLVISTLYKTEWR